MPMSADIESMDQLTPVDSVEDITGIKSQHGSLVEVTIKSLDGIVFETSVQDADIHSAPRMTATVAFSSSSPSMKVFTSSICALTGQLLIESEPMELDKVALSENNGVFMSANWRAEVEASATAGSELPHLTLTVPVYEAPVSKTPLSPSSHKSAKVLKDTDTSEGDAVETLSTVTHLTSSTISTRKDGCAQGSKRGSNVFCSASSSSTPEIVELFVRLKCEGEDTPEHLWQGVAYLVLYGNEYDKGTHTIDLPIRRPSYADETNGGASDTSSSRLQLSSNSHLKVKVSFATEKDASGVSSVDCQSAVVQSRSTDSTADLIYANSTIDIQLDLLKQKIVENEEIAREHYQNQQRKTELTRLHTVPEQPTNDPFCHALENFAQVYNLLSGVMTGCEVVNNMNVLPELPDSGSSVCSTIATRESLGI
jgi:hypothetical protein